MRQAEAANGFGKRKRFTVTMEGLVINMPLLIDSNTRWKKLEPLLNQIMRMVGDMEW
jgi:hypothetical protein